VPTNPLFFAHLPQRPAKPRQTGLTMVRDDGQPLSQIQAILDSYGHLFDYMKFRQFVTWYMEPAELRAKIDACTGADVRTFLGGTVLEVAHLHGQTEYALEAMQSYGLTAVEVSSSMARLTMQQLSRVVGLAKDAGFEVLYEYGKKFQEEALDVAGAISNIRALLEAGASRIIVERWQLDAALGEDGKAESAGRIVELADAVGLESLVFEAETLAHQVWLLRELGPDVNLGPNIDPFHVPAKLEPFRNGIGSEVGYWVFERVREASGLDVPGPELLSS
jgi:phosphosulfolactate synthase